MRTELKNLALSSKSLVVAYGIYSNWRARRRYNLGDIRSTHGSTHRRKSLHESLRYINEVYEDYLNYSGLAPAWLRGMRILEVGPGDSLGVALKFAAAGASRVVCLDKFRSEADPSQQREIYLAVRESLDGDELRRFDDAVSLSSGIELNPERVTYLCGAGIEEASESFEPGAFDLIVSRAVLQEVHDIDSAFYSMDRLLSSGGHIAHKIDLSDEGMFSLNGMHPLTFLTIPRSVYEAMTRHASKSNRRLADYYRAKMVELEYDARVFVTGILGCGELRPHKEGITLEIDCPASTLTLVDEIRPKLCAEFKDIPYEDLIVSGVFITARKPGTETRRKDVTKPGVDGQLIRG
jgi:hypothetical protein